MTDIQYYNYSYAYVATKAVYIIVVRSRLSTFTGPRNALLHHTTVIKSGFAIANWQLG